MAEVLYYQLMEESALGTNATESAVSCIDDETALRSAPASQTERSRSRPLCESSSPAAGREPGSGSCVVEQLAHCRHCRALLADSASNQLLHVLMLLQRPL
jgi:hypothetical protein